MSEDEDNDNAGIIAHPPIFYIISVIVALIIDYFVPLAMGEAPILKMFAILMAVLGIGIFISAGKMFRTDKQNVSVHTKTESIYQSGIYSRTRNPIYLGVLMVVIAGGIYFDEPWIFITQIPLVLFFNKQVIGKEEAYLERKFGAEYIEYKKKVRRWI